MKLACVQTDVVFGNPEANASAAIRHLESLAEAGVELAVFPEAFLTGYSVDTALEATAIAIDREDDSLLRLQAAANRFDIVVILGFGEKDGDNLYNCAALLEPGVAPRFYRKSHLPCLGLDRFVLPGNELPVFDTRLGRIGILICFDLRAPEATRVLALAGADLLVLPTNWPEGAETSADYVAIARAHENRIFIATCNRVGEEGGFRFIGRSKILAASGKVLAGAGGGEEVLTADIDLAEARQKRIINVPERYEIDVHATRRPELYGSLLDPIAQ